MNKDLSELKESILDTLATIVAIAFITIPIVCAMWFSTLQLFDPLLSTICTVLIVPGLYSAELYLLYKLL